jgi:hypothetical protein
MLGTAEFSSLEEKKLEEAQFRSKPKTVLTLDVQLDFNGCTLTMENACTRTMENGEAIMNLK